MKNLIEIRVIYFVFGLAVGALLATAIPLVEQLPNWELEELK